MKTIQITIGTIITIITLFVVLHQQANASLTSTITPLTKPTTDDNAPAIQLAILLDNSGSMSGLIDQTKAQLWKIVNELNTLERNGQSPTLNIGLYTHGDTNIRQLSEFTTDLDKISEELFNLGIQGGDEYCGAAINKSIKELNWSDNPNSLKMIYIAGNESFAQGHIAYRDAIAKAQEKGVVINTIFCGPAKQGIQLEWGEGARLGDGDYTNIDHNQKTAYVATPYDDQISQFNTQLNDTYVSYGSQGSTLQSNQILQDQNAVGFSKSNMAERAAFKSSKNYDNSKWDLVDAYNKDKSIVKKKAKLPKELQNKSEAEVKAHVMEKMKQRTEIQNKIKELNTKRKSYIAEQQKADGKESNLEQSIIKSVNKQAKKKGYSHLDDTKKK